MRGSNQEIKTGFGYDPNSLLTGEEIEAGFGYEDPRQWPDAETRERALWGEIGLEDIPKIAPRAHKPVNQNHVTVF